MTAIFKLVCDTETIDLVYDASTQPQYRLLYGGRLQIEETRILQHTPDFGTSTPVRGFDDDRTYFLTVDFGADETTGNPICRGWDSPLNAIIALKRLVDGAGQQALRFHTEGDVEPVDLVVQTDTASTTNDTTNCVKWGFVDDGAFFLDDISKFSEIPRSVIVALRLTEYGEGAAITLCNILFPDPGMVLDDDANGLVDGLVATAPAPTFALDSTFWVVNGSSQEAIAAAVATVEGFRTLDVTTGGAADAVAYAWLHIVAGGDSITLTLVGSVTGDITSITMAPGDTGSVSDRTFTDVNGNVWYRVSLSASVAAEATVRLRVARESGSTLTTWYTDALYVQVGTSPPVPVPWSSPCGIDGTEQIGDSDHIDVWGIPGDTDALVKHDILSVISPGFVRNIAIGRMRDGAILAADQPHWLDVDDVDFITFAPGGTWATVADATTTNAFYARYTSAGDVTGTVSNTFTGQGARDLLATTRAVYVRARTSDSDTLFSLDVTEPSGVFDGTPIDLVGTGTWEFAFLGILNGKSVLPADVPDPAGSPIMTFTISVDPDGAGDTGDVDALLLFPIDDDYLLASLDDDFDPTDHLFVVGDGEFLATTTGGQRESGVLGSMWTAKEGNKTNRWVYLFLMVTNEHTITSDFDITITVTPRTRNLLGTL